MIIIKCDNQTVKPTSQYNRQNDINHQPKQSNKLTITLSEIQLSLSFKRRQSAINYFICNSTWKSKCIQRALFGFTHTLTFTSYVPKVGKFFLVGPKIHDNRQQTLWKTTPTTTDVIS